MFIEKIEPNQVNGYLSKWLKVAIAPYSQIIQAATEI